MQPCRNNEWVRVFEVFDLSNRSIPRLSPAAPSMVSSTIANALMSSNRSRRVGSPMRVAPSPMPNRPQVSNDDGKQVVFSSVPAEANSQTRQLRGVLHGLDATPVTPVTVLSDGADGPRSLGEAASPGPTHHVLDWFHLSMRVQHVAQAAKSWPDAAEGDRQTGARLAETVERI